MSMESKEALVTDFGCTDSTDLQGQIIGGFGLFMRFVDSNKNRKYLRKPHALTLLHNTFFRSCRALKAEQKSMILSR